MALSKVWVHAELTPEGEVAPISLELLAKARDYAAREPGSEDTNRAYYLWWEGEHEVLPLGDLA